MRFSWFLTVISLILAPSAYSQSATCAASDISSCSNDALIKLISDNLDTSDSPDMNLVEKTEAELIKRKATMEAVEFFNRAQSLADYGSAYRLLQAMRNKSIDTALKSAATEELTLKAYIANMYFADVGNTFALANLNKNYYRYEIPSFVWAETVLLFGKYKYFPAKYNVVSTINAAEENLSDASIESLEMFYPETKGKAESLGNLEKTAQFYAGYVKKH